MSGTLLTAVAFVVVYVVSCLLSAALPIARAPVPTLWLGSGVLVGVLIRSPLQTWWIAIASAVGIGSVVFVASVNQPIQAALALAAAQVVACAITAAVFRTATHTAPSSRAAIDFGQTRSVLQFFLIICFGGALLNATFGTAVLATGHEVLQPAHVWLRWAVSHLLGIVLMSPLWLMRDEDWRATRAELSPARTAEAMAALLLLGVTLFQVYWREPVDTPRAYFTLPPLLWLTLRFRVPGAVVGMVVATAAAVAATNAGLGLYAHVPPDRMATGLPGLLAVGSFCFISLGAAVTQVRRTSHNLDLLNRSLAVEVDQQTSSLTAAMSRLRLAIDGAGMGTWQWTLGTRESSTDSRQREILGLPPDGPISGDQIFERIHPDDVARLRGDFERWIRDGGPWVYEHRVRDPDGRIRWVSGRAVLIREAGGRAIATGVTFDITRQKLEERGRRRAERQVRQLADCAPATLWATDREGQTTFRSRDWYVLTGQPDDSGLNLGWLDQVHRDDREKVWTQLLDAHVRRAAFSVEYRVHAADGAILWVLDNGRPFVSDDGVFQGLVGSMADITQLRKVSDEQQRAEMALRESDERFRQMAHHLDAGLWVVELTPSMAQGDTVGAPQVEVQYISPGFRRVWNIEEGPLEDRGALWSRLVHPEDRERLHTTFRAFVEAGADYDIEYRIVIPSGELRWVHERAYAVSRDEVGAIRRVAGLTIDVTERHRVEQELRDADRQKDAFLAMLAHELRNPLAPIRTATEVLGMAGLDDAMRTRAREIIERQVVHITRLVDDLLDVSRLSRGRLQLHRAPVDLAATVRETAADYVRFLADAKLVLDLRIVDEPLWVDGDATRLAQVLGNLLHNVRKFTPPGGTVEVSLRRENDGVVRLGVYDSGDGIAPDLLPRIFEPFSQGGQTIDRSPGGLGLGLSLVKGLVELHGGSVAVASEGHGRGTHFDIRLPLIPAPSGAVALDAQAPQPAGLAVLVVEDNLDAADTLRLLLELDGHAVSVVHTAHDGIDAATRTRPDLVLCDIGLPGDLNGLDVARALRARETCPRLVAVTGYAGAEHVRAAEAAGFDRHVTKPVGAALIRQLVAETWRAKRESQSDPGASA